MIYLWNVMHHTECFRRTPSDVISVQLKSPLSQYSQNMWAHVEENPSKRRCIEQDTKLHHMIGLFFSPSVLRLVSLFVRYCAFSVNLPFIQFDCCIRTKMEFLISLFILCYNLFTPKCPVQTLHHFE